MASQVNPHVVPFYAHLQGRPGRPSGGRDHTGSWRGGFLLGALEVALKEAMRSNLRTLQKLHLLVDLFGVDWSNLWLQSQDGSVVLTPDLELRHYAGVLSNVASLADLQQKMRSMERATWEALPLIRTRTDVDDALAALDLEVHSTASPKAAPLARVPSKTGEGLGEVGQDDGGDVVPPPAPTPHAPPAAEAGARHGRRAAASPARRRSSREDQGIR